MAEGAGRHKWSACTFSDDHEQGLIHLVVFSAKWAWYQHKSVGLSGGAGLGVWYLGERKCLVAERDDVTSFLRPAILLRNCSTSVESSVFCTVLTAGEATSTTLSAKEARDSKSSLSSLSALQLYRQVIAACVLKAGMVSYLPNPLH